jgi:hypothetical protein
VEAKKKSLKAEEEVDDPNAKVLPEHFGVFTSFLFFSVFSSESLFFFLFFSDGTIFYWLFFP